MTDTNGLLKAAGGPRPKDDLVERLHWEADNKGLPPFDGWGWLHHAAAEIERLRAENAAVKAANLSISESARKMADERDALRAERDKWYKIAGELEAEARRLDHERDALRADAERLLEPTEEMIVAGVKTLLTGHDSQRHYVVALWRRMFDAARKEKP